MPKSILLLIVSTTLVFSQESNTHWDCLRFAELSSVQIVVSLSQDNTIFYESNVQAKVFAELQRQIPLLKVVASAQDHIYVFLSCKRMELTPNSEPFYFGSTSVALQRPAKLFLNRSYFDDAEPVYFAEVWERGATFWGKKDYILSSMQKQLEDIVGMLAYDYTTSTNEIQKVIEVKQK